MPSHQQLDSARGGGVGFGVRRDSGSGGLRGGERGTRGQPRRSPHIQIVVLLQAPRHCGYHPPTKLRVNVADSTHGHGGHHLGW
jgi:hypothetical protein